MMKAVAGSEDQGVAGLARQRREELLHLATIRWRTLPCVQGSEWQRSQ